MIPLRTKAQSASTLIPERPPASTPEGRDALLAAYAYDLVEKRLREGTASSQETVFILKLGSQREKLEMEKLKKENALLKAKTEAIASEQERSEMYRNAIEAMRRYSAHITDD